MPKQPRRPGRATNFTHANKHSRPGRRGCVIGGSFFYFMTYFGIYMLIGLFVANGWRKKNKIDDTKQSVGGIAGNTIGALFIALIWPLAVARL